MYCCTITVLYPYKVDVGHLITVLYPYKVDVGHLKIILKAILKCPISQKFNL